MYEYLHCHSFVHSRMPFVVGLITVFEGTGVRSQKSEVGRIAFCVGRRPDRRGQYSGQCSTGVRSTVSIAGAQAGSEKSRLQTVNILARKGKGCLARQSTIHNPQSTIHNPQSTIHNLKWHYSAEDSDSRGLATGSRQRSQSAVMRRMKQRVAPATVSMTGE
jgi:hypothetical protein